MLLTCVALEPTLPQAVRLGKFYRPGEQEFPIAVGASYVAYGLRVWGAGAWVDVETAGGYLVVVPLCLFTITDARACDLWEVRQDSDGDLAILPAELHAPFFLDDLSSGLPQATGAFRALKERMAIE